MTDANALDFLTDLIARAQRAGADAADALVVESRSVSVAQRLRQPEHLQRAETWDLGLRVFVGRRSAIVSGTDRDPRTVAAMVERAVAMARAAPEDEFAGLAEPGQIARELPALDICDPSEPNIEALIERARAAEEAALAVAGVSNSDGAEAGWGSSRVALAASNGFAGGYERSGHSVSAVALAGSGTAMERDYDASSTVYGADLRSPEEIGRTAGERAVARLGARQPSTAPVPVVFDRRISAGLLGHLVGAINGAAIARGTSFLKNSLGKRILPAGVNVVDDPLRPRGLASKPVDGEGLATRRHLFVEDGVLTSWVLDLHSARRLGLESTGNAARGTSSPPSPSTSNLWLEPGAVTPEALIADIAQGFLVTSLMGMGVSLVTGDYSRGAAGFWIENGQVAYPVSEATIAGTLQEMFLNMAAADDLEFRGSVNAPTIRIDGMTVAGR